MGRVFGLKNEVKAEDYNVFEKDFSEDIEDDFDDLEDEDNDDLYRPRKCNSPKDDVPILTHLHEYNVNINQRKERIYETYTFVRSSYRKTAK